MLVSWVARYDWIPVGPWLYLADASPLTPAQWVAVAAAPPLTFGGRWCAVVHRAESVTTSVCWRSGGSADRITPAR